MVQIIGEIMAKRNKEIHIEGFGPDKNEFAVYSDLIWWSIEKIEGVSNVSDVMKEHEGYLVVTIDKRYNINEVLSEIKALANPTPMVNKQKSGKSLQSQFFKWLGSGARF